MKKSSLLILTICFCGLFIACDGTDDKTPEKPKSEEPDPKVPGTDNGTAKQGEYVQFMNTLSATIPAVGGSVEFNSSHSFMYISHVNDICEGDTIKKAIPETSGPQIIKGDWYTIETEKEEGKNGPSKVQVTAISNVNGSERKLRILVAYMTGNNVLVVTQEN